MRAAVAFGYCFGLFGIVFGVEGVMLQLNTDTTAAWWAGRVWTRRSVGWVYYHSFLFSNRPLSTMGQDGWGRTILSHTLGLGGIFHAQLKLCITSLVMKVSSKTSVVSAVLRGLRPRS